MTRASLLHILDHANGMAEAEVRELEQLAAAFPYCQTAHLLLAKVAHDQGSMLAGQRLRRAATYAADRELLRRLLEYPIAPSPAAPAETTLPDAAQPDAAPEPDAFAVALAPAAPQAQPESAEAATEVAAIEPATTESAAASDTQDPARFPETEPGPAVANWPEPAPERPENEVPETAEELGDISAGEFSSSADEPVVLLVATPDKAVAAANNDLLPALPPPIRPPAEAGISRFEFGLADSRLPTPSSYRLPGLDEEEELPGEAEPAEQPPLITAPFRADAELGYALGAGSRLGYDLRSRTDGFTLDLPLEAFFEPDALLLAHARAHQPRPKFSSLDLINRFLKVQPRIKTPSGVPLPATEQADLAVRSNNAAPALASESLAKIMVKQGKTAKAIEIYERLMVRQPEKKAYFAEQIQQLQQPPE
ncbi:hypothetical protein CDA63_16035 [Hymenobacter amundsenii]|uniref:Uncharacterized protein n=1 Tax=Hymenobacter amundsenii TaxID=2006685 RepID=A0A246FHS6_9BACT|nr:hypothetical protein [Hymenobacter amundsenii]OWP62082.1 hypothetical protein CDA63_16035 [Hymenobacter amundsenii]